MQQNSSLSTLPYPLLLVSGGLLLWPSFFSDQSNTVVLIGGGLLLAMIVWLYALRAYPLTWSRAYGAPVLFLTWLLLVTVFNHTASFSARPELSWWIFGITWLYLCAWLSQVNSWPTTLNRWLLIIQVGMAIVALVLWLRDPAQRATGLLFNANGYGGFALWGIAVFVAWLSHQPRRWWVMAGAIVLGVAFFLTISLTAWVAGVLTGLVALIVFWKNLSRRFMLWLTVLLVLGIGSVVALWRIPTVRSLMDLGHIQFSYSQRREFAIASWQMGLDRPLTGWGVGSFQIMYPRYAQQVNEQPRYPHNLFAQLLAETGFVGAGLWMLAVIVIGWSGWRSWRLAIGTERIAVGGLWFGWLAFTIHAALDFSWQFPAGQVWWWAASGIFLGRRAWQSSSGWVAGRWERTGLAMIGLVLILWTGRAALSHLAVGRAEMAKDVNVEVAERSAAAYWWPDRSRTTALANALWLRRGTGDIAQARGLIEAAHQQNTEDYLFDYWEGILARANGEDQRALAAFERAYERDPVFHLEHAIEYARELGQAGQREKQHQVIQSTLDRYRTWRRFDNSPIESQLETLRSLKI